MGKIKTSHGMTAKIVVIRDAVLSARTEPDSRKAFQIWAKPLAFVPGLSTRKEISTAIFSVSFASIFRCAAARVNDSETGAHGI